jgi:hypothetical protein
MTLKFIAAAPINFDRGYIHRQILAEALFTFTKIRPMNGTAMNNLLASLPSAKADGHQTRV